MTANESGTAGVPVPGSPPPPPPGPSGAPAYSPPATPMLRPLGPPVAKGPGIMLIVLGALSTLANGLFVGMVLSGELEESLRDAGYEVENEGLFTFAVLSGTIVGILALISGILVLRRSRTGRVLGMISGVLLAVGYVANLVGGLGNLLTVVLLGVAVSAVIQLARAKDAFNPPAPHAPTSF